MENNYITVCGYIFNVDKISTITKIKEHQSSQCYFRVYADGECHTEFEFNYSTYGITQSNKDEFIIKLENEHKKLETYLLEGTGPKRFFNKIDLRK